MTSRGDSNMANVYTHLNVGSSQCQHLVYNRNRTLCANSAQSSGLYSLSETPQDLALGFGHSLQGLVVVCICIAFSHCSIQGWVITHIFTVFRLVLIIVWSSAGTCCLIATSDNTTSVCVIIYWASISINENHMQH